MTIGFVTIRGRSEGEHVRPAAIKGYFERNDIEYRDLAIDGPSEGCNIGLVNNIPIVLKKLALGSRYSVSAECNTKRKIKSLGNLVKYATETLLNNDGEVSVYHAETQIPAYICSVVKEHTGKQYVFDMRGLLVEETIALGGAERLVETYKKIERRAVKEALRVIVVSNAMKRVVIGKYKIPEENVVVIPNAAASCERRAKFSEKPKIIYAGIFSYWERVEDYLRTVRIMDDDDCRFFLMGDGYLRQKLMDYINNHYVDICYLGRRKMDDTRKILAEMTVGMAPSTSDVVRKVASPLKIFSYAACGLPVVTVDVGEWSDIVKEYDCGIVVDDSNPVEFRKAINRLKDRGTWEKKAANGIRMIMDRYNWDDVLEPLREIYN